MKNQTKVGIGIMITKDRRVLLGKRKGSHGAGEYAFPGGHLEYMESFKDCVLRELAEECGEMLRISNIQFVHVANIMEYAPKHYLHIGLKAYWESGEPKLIEPHDNPQRAGDFFIYYVQSSALHILMLRVEL